jgi:nucleoside-diphosphate-sugar epimerase
MYALVTGCAGFIGSHLTESLLADGHEVLGVDCFNDNYGRADKLDNLAHAQQWDRFQFVPIDLARGDLVQLVGEVDVCFHLAAEPGVRASWGARFDNYTRNNVLATQHLLEAARQAGGRRVVYASSSSIYGNAERLPTPEDTLPAPFSPYGVTKLAAEHLCGAYAANHGVETVALRYFTVYGPRQRPDMAFNIFSRAVLDGEPIRVFGDGRQTRDFTYVADIVAATRAAAEREGVAGRVYNIGGGSRISVREAIELLEAAAGRRAQVEYVEQMSGDVRDTGADTTRARAELGFAPVTSVREGLLREFEWVAERAAARTAQ